MKKYLRHIALSFCIFALALSASAQAGLMGVQKQGNDWFLTVPDSLLGRRMLVTVRYTSAPANTGQYGGEMVNQQTVYFERQADKLLLRSELLVNYADSLNAINRAVTISNAAPIIGAFKPEGRAGKATKIKVTEFFNEDNPALGLTPSRKKQFGVAGLIGSASFIESIKTFPLNTEVRTVKTFSSPQPTTTAGYRTGKVTLGLNISFVLLPKKPMMRRLFDPRVGYFTDQFSEYSDYQQRVEPKRFITRWRLEPKNAEDAEKWKRGELIEPKKQIVYYIDPATPRQWRPYLIQGVNDWQVAFEQAGFKNAIVAKEWPDSDKTMSMEDARFSVIRYLASPIANAYGPQVHDPRSGEILESHICWYHNVMTLVHDWYMVQAGTLDEAARQMVYGDELMGQLIRFVSSHEVGHTLGLRHNFGSSSTVPTDSLRDKAWVEAHGHTPSIMDYARFNYVAQPEDGISHEGIFPRIGDYDKWAIQWGYTLTPDAWDDVSDHEELEKLFTPAVKQNRHLWFGDGETNSTRDGRCQTEDLGDDAVKSSRYGIMNLKRMLPLLPQWTYQRNDIFGRNLSGIYGQLTNQYYRYLGHVLGNVGSVEKDYGTVSEGGTRYRNLPRARQKECLQFVLDEVVLNEPRWLIQPAFVRTLSPDVQDFTRSLGRNITLRILSGSLLEEMNAEYPVTDYMADLRTAYFADLYSGANVPDAYHRSLQNAFVGTLCSRFGGLELDNRSRPAVLQTLRTLQKSLKDAPAVGDATVQAHREALLDTLERTLAVKGQ